MFYPIFRSGKEVKNKSFPPQKKSEKTAKRKSEGLYFLCFKIPLMISLAKLDMKV